MRVRSFPQDRRVARAPKRRGLVLLSVFVAALFALAGCGGDGNVLRASGAGAVQNGAVPAAATPVFLAQSADRTVALETGRIEANLSGPGVDVTVTGSFDTAARSAALTVEAAIDGEANSADVVLAGDALYVRPDGFAAALGEAMGTPWVKADVGQLMSMVPGAVELPTIDPAELASRLEAEGVTVTEIGAESVRGVAATRYRADVPADAEHQLPASTIDLWIDESGVIRRVDVVSEDYRGRAELVDLGQPVSITVPSPAEVTDLGDLEGLLGKLPR